jgi:hypothetical protein
MNEQESFDASVYIPKFMAVFQLTEEHDKLKKNTYLVRYSFSCYYTIGGWYADKDSRKSKEYIIPPAIELAKMNFVGYYQYTGRQIKGAKHLLDLVPENKRKAVLSSRRP